MRSLALTTATSGNRRINLRKQITLLGLLLIIEAAFMTVPLLVWPFVTKI